MDIKQLKSSDKAISVLRTRGRRSLRFNPLASGCEPSIESKVQKEDFEEQMKLLKQKLVNTEDQLKLSNKQKNDEIEALKQKLINTDTQLKLKGNQVESLKRKLVDTEVQLKLSNEYNEDKEAQIVALKQELEKTKAKLDLAKNLMHSDFHINSLTEDDLVEIFKYLPQNKLAQISRVCRRWNETTKHPMLWKKVDVNFRWHHGSQNEITSIFAKRLSTSITHMTLNFDFCSWKVGLNFEEFFVKLKGMFSQLHTLSLDNVLFLVSLPSMIDLCSELLPNLKVLMLPVASFGIDYKEREYRGHPKIEVLDIAGCKNVGRSIMYSFLKMPSLKKLNISGLRIGGYFWKKENVSFLRQLEYLDLEETDICSRTFRVLNKHAVNLTELFLCWTELEDDDFIFDNSMFPRLKKICIRFCDNVTYEGIVYFARSCPSLQTIYVETHVAQSFARHPFITANMDMLGIVNADNGCQAHNILDF